MYLLRLGFLTVDTLNKSVDEIKGVHEVLRIMFIFFVTMMKTI